MHMCMHMCMCTHTAHAHVHVHAHCTCVRLNVPQDYEKLDAYFHKLTVHKQHRPDAPSSVTRVAQRVELYLEATISGL